MPRPAPILLLLAACAPRPSPVSVEPDQVEAVDVLLPEDSLGDHENDPVTPPAPEAAGTMRPGSCWAPLTVIEEIDRLLATAATHATRSAACRGGEGRRVAIDRVQVCPIPAKEGPPAFDVRYHAVVFPEGDARGCGAPCPRLEPRAREGRARVELEPRGDAFVVQVPVDLPGLPPDATAPWLSHDGDCYGPSPAFEPRPIRLGGDDP